MRATMNGRLKIVVPSFNSVKYLPKTLHSIEMQRFSKPFDVCVIDDASTLPEQRTILTHFCQKNGWQSIFHSTNQGALVSLVDGIQALNCQENDVIIVLDGDDWLAHDQVLTFLDQIYQDPEIYLTYGSFESHPPHCLNITYATPLPREVIELQLYRQIPWIFQHPRTFRFHLWQRLNQEDLKDEAGNYYKISGDRAFFYPLLEMSGFHTHFINQILYIYNLENPLNDHKIDRQEQVDVEWAIKMRKKYAPLDSKI